MLGGKNMYPKAFYSVFGVNGLGVFTDYAKLLNSKKFITAFNCKKHKTYLDAKRHAIESYNARQEFPENRVSADADLKMPYNRVLYRKNIAGGNNNG